METEHREVMPLREKISCFLNLRGKKSTFFVFSCWMWGAGESQPRDVGAGGSKAGREDAGTKQEERRRKKGEGRALQGPRAQLPPQPFMPHRQLE